MKTKSLLAVVAVFAVACGSESTPRSEGPFPLTLTIENISNEERVCQFSYVMGEEYVTIVGATLLAPREVRTAEVLVPEGDVVSITAACWHPSFREDEGDGGAPDEADPLPRASTKLTTTPIRGPVTCNAIYDEFYGPNMALPCYGT